MQLVFFVALVGSGQPSLRGVSHEKFSVLFANDNLRGLQKDDQIPKWHRAGQFGCMWIVPMAWAEKLKLSF